MAEPIDGLLADTMRLCTVVLDSMIVEVRFWTLVAQLPARWDNPTMIVTLDEKRRLTVPLALAPTTPGDAFDARFDDEEDAIVFRRIKRGGKSWLEVLKACPVPIEDLPPRSREYPRKPRL